MTIDQLDNYSRKAAAWLPEITVDGPKNPVVQIIDQDDGQIVYTIRINGKTFQPRVFKQGAYTIKLGYPETDTFRTLKGITALDDKTRTLKVTF